MNSSHPIAQFLRQTALCTLLLVLVLSLPRCYAEDTDWEKMNEQGLKAMKDNNLDSAETIFKQAEEKLTENGHQEADLATIKHHLGELYEKQGKFHEAETYYKDALDIRKEVLGDDNLLTARSMVNLGRMYEKEGKHTEASDTFNRAGVVIDNTLGGHYPGIRHQSDLVNWLDNGVDKDEKVAPHATLHADQLQDKHGPNHPESASKLNDLADFYRAHGKFDQAEELYKRAAEIDPAKEPTDAGAAQRYTDLAAMYQHKGNMDEAQKYFEKAESVLESTEAGLDKRGTTFNKMAHFYEAKGDNEKAEKYYKDALEAREQFSDERLQFENKGVDKPIAETLGDYAKFLHKVGKDEAAEKLDSRAHDILDSLK